MGWIAISRTIHGRDGYTWLVDHGVQWITTAWFCSSLVASHVIRIIPDEKGSLAWGVAALPWAACFVGRQSLCKRNRIGTFWKSAVHSFVPGIWLPEMHRAECPNEMFEVPAFPIVEDSPPKPFLALASNRGWKASSHESLKMFET